MRTGVDLPRIGPRAAKTTTTLTCANSYYHALMINHSREVHRVYHKIMILIHYSDFKMGAMASQITSLTIVYSRVYSGADQRKHQSSASLTFVTGEFSAQITSNAENISIWWRHHDHSLRVSWGHQQKWYWFSSSFVSMSSNHQHLKSLRTWVVNMRQWAGSSLLQVTAVVLLGPSHCWVYQL